MALTSNYRNLVNNIIAAAGCCVAVTLVRYIVSLAAIAAAAIIIASAIIIAAIPVGTVNRVGKRSVGEVAGRGVGSLAI